MLHGILRIVDRFGRRRLVAALEEGAETHGSARAVEGAGAGSGPGQARYAVSEHATHRVEGAEDQNSISGVGLGRRGGEGLERRDMAVQRSARRRLETAGLELGPQGL